MKFKSKLIQGTVIKRYKRFFADITLDSGEIVIAHVPNTGSMKTCLEPGWKCLVSHHDAPKRKLKYTLEMTHNGVTWIGVNTHITTNLALEGFEQKSIIEFNNFNDIKKEVVYGESRLDLLLTNTKNQNKKFVEIKNVTLLGEKRSALFPDAKSERGTKHLHELMKIIDDGDQASMLFIIQREDVDSFSPAELIDPIYTKTLKEAYKKGVQILCYRCSLGPEEIKIDKKIEFKL